MGSILTVDPDLGVGEAFGLLLLDNGFVGSRVPSMTLSGKQGMWSSAYGQTFLRALSSTAWLFVYTFLLRIVYLV